MNQILNKASNGILNHIGKEERTKSILFSVDAMGRLLDGDMGNVINENYDSPEGYVVSIDEKVQRITNNACASMKQGCAIVMDISDN